MGTTEKRPVYANAFGAFGYVFLVFSWLWSTLIVGYSSLSTQNITWLIPKNADQPIGTSEPSSLVSGPVAITIGLVVTIFIVLTTLYVFIALPKSIGKRGSTVTRKAASLIVPIVTHHQPLPETRRVFLTSRIIMVLKSIACLLPVTALLVFPNTTTLSYEVVLICSLFFSLFTVALFTVQYALARLLHIPRELLW
ncbi:MAG: hypothetical protein WAT31_04085 [Candidatus Saccharimonas aalborgensis]